jgi:hypothetical protein
MILFRVLMFIPLFEFDEDDDDDDDDDDEGPLPPDSEIESIFPMMVLVLELLWETYESFTSDHALEGMDWS